MAVPKFHAAEALCGEVFSAGAFAGTEWEGCTFSGCRFEGTDLSGVLMADCRFEDCVFTLVPLGGAVLRNLFFSGCRFTGLCFGDCMPFGFEVDFVDSELDNCTFTRLKMKSVRFEGCRLRECFSGDCGLSVARFPDTAMPGTVFEGCDLRKADFRSATDWTLDPRTNLVSGARFADGNLAGLLHGFDIVIE